MKSLWPHTASEVRPQIYSIQPELCWNRKVVRMTALVFTGDVEDKLQRLQWISRLSTWQLFSFCVQLVFHCGFVPFNFSYPYPSGSFHWHWDCIHGLAQDCSNSIANALELLQSCTVPLILLSHCQGSTPEKYGQIHHGIPIKITISSQQKKYNKTLCIFHGIQIHLFDVILQNQTWIDTYILNFDICFLSIVNIHRCWYGDPH